MNADPTATEVERWKIQPGRGENPNFITSPDGDWVRYEDYEKLKEEFVKILHAAKCVSNAHLTPETETDEQCLTELEYQCTLQRGFL